MSPAPAQEINDVCQGGQQYGNDHHVAIIKVVHLQLDSDKKRRHFGDISVGFGPSKVDLIVAVGVLETVKGHNAGLGTAREENSGEVNELDELEGFESDQFVEVTRNDEAAEG